MTPQEILETKEVQEWLTYLEENPEKHYTGMLGILEENELEKGCCLGAYLYLTNNYKIINNNKSWLCDLNNCKKTLEESFSKLFLHSPEGQLKEELTREETLKYFPDYTFNYNPTSLANLNDHGAKWPEIAKFIRENPELVFQS